MYVYNFTFSIALYRNVYRIDHLNIGPSELNLSSKSLALKIAWPTHFGMSELKPMNADADEN